MKTGMLYDGATIRAVASTLRKHFKEKTLRLVCDPVFVSTSGYALLADGALGSLIEEILPLATLITPNKSEAEHILSHERKEVTISRLADMVSASRELLDLGPKAVLLKGGHVTTTMTEVDELLARDPGISVYKYGLLDENMNILQVRLSSEDQISRLVVDVLQDSTGQTGREVGTSIFIRPRIVSTDTHGAGCMLSAAIACGLASGLTSNLSSCFPFSRLIVAFSVPEAVRDGTAYTHLGILHAFPVGAGHGQLNHTHSVVSRFVPRWVDLPLGLQTYMLKRFPQTLPGRQVPFDACAYILNVFDLEGVRRTHICERIREGIVGQEAFRPFHQVCVGCRTPWYVRLTFPVGKITTTSNTMQGPSRARVE